MDTYVKVEKAEIVRTSDKAWLMNIEEKEIWIPKSQVKDFEMDEPNNTDSPFCSFEIPEWLAIDKELA